MAVFVGNVEEFTRFIGPRVRNIVNIITRGYRHDIGYCQGIDGNVCGNTENLESAHVRGRSRPALISELLEPFIYNEQIVIDLERFEQELKDKHYPLDETILVLCRSCHRKYDDKRPSKIDDEIAAEGTDIFANKDVLEIVFMPEDMQLFKEKLLLTKRAKIMTYYKGSVVPDVSDWKADKIKDASNIIGNIRSRPKFRSGEWQRLGIERVVVQIA